MAEFIFDFNLIVLMIVCFVGFLVFITRWTKSPGHLRQRVTDRDSEIKDWKHKFNVMNGRLSRMQRGEIVDQQTAESIKSSANPADAIPDLLNNAANFLPKQLGFIAKNPQVQGWLKTLAKEHPNEAKEILSKYLPKITEIGSKETTLSRL